MFNPKGVEKAVWVRIIGMIIVFVNLVSVSLFDLTIIPYEDHEVYEGVSAVLTVVYATYLAWKNNSLTKEAQDSDRHMRNMKKKGK